MVSISEELHWCNMFSKSGIQISISLGKFKVTEKQGCGGVVTYCLTSQSIKPNDY